MSLGSGGQQGGGVYERPSYVASHLLMRRRAASTWCSEGLGRRVHRLGRLSQVLYLLLEDINGAVGLDQVFSLLLISGL